MWQHLLCTLYCIIFNLTVTSLFALFNIVVGASELPIVCGCMQLDAFSCFSLVILSQK